MGTEKKHFSRKKIFFLFFIVISQENWFDENAMIFFVLKLLNAFIDEYN